jgi:hypothetical protein
MRRIMTETYTPGAGKYVYDSIQATTFHDTLKTQDYYGRPVPVAVGDLILLNEREGPEDGVDLSVEVLAKPDPIGLWPEFQKICRRAGLDLHTTTMPVYLETIENNPVLREAFVKHAKGQVWFFTNHQDIDVRNRDTGFRAGRTTSGSSKPSCPGSRPATSPFPNTAGSFRTTRRAGSRSGRWSACSRCRRRRRTRRMTRRRLSPISRNPGLEGVLRLIGAAQPPRAFPAPSASVKTGSHASR